MGTHMLSSRQPDTHCSRLRNSVKSGLKVLKPMRSLPFLAFCSVFGVAGWMSAQTPPATPTPTPAPAPPQATDKQAADKQAADKKDASQSAPPAKRETVAKPMTEKQKKKQEAKLRKELETPYRKWLNEEVVYIITDEEKKAFKAFATDEEREQFIEQFWLRRDPTPDTEENEFREEHY